MLYTRKGDNGTTKTFGCDQRISKSSAIAEALGSLDEINSFLGLVKVEADKKTAKLVHTIQENLFIIQAEVAGFPKPLPKGKVKEIEKIIDDIEKKLPPIKTFFISGGTKLGALFDSSRTIARRAERRVVEVLEEGKHKISPETLAYLNRLSSLLYALARLSNHKSGINEVSPKYE
jgi:cob(I)alamin adenosyltransferase